MSRNLDRRAYLGLTTGALATLAGCSSGSNDAGAADTDTTGSAPATTATTTSTGSQYHGPTEENATYVDLQYREFTGAEIETIKANATSPSYDTLLRNIGSYVGDAVHYRASIKQVMELPDIPTTFYLFLAIDGSWERIAYGSWVGERVIRGDTVDIWARVLGTESYQTGSGSQITVPAVAIADLELLSDTTSTTSGE